MSQAVAATFDEDIANLPAIDLPTDQTVTESITTSKDAAVELAKRAASVEINDDNDAANASAFLVELKTELNAHEERRTKLTGPLHRRKKEIDERFKAVRAPMEAADRAIRGKLSAYEAKRRAEREAEQRRLEEEARARQAEIEAQARAAEEAARAEREAAERQARKAAEAAAAAAQAALERDAAIAKRAAATPDERLAEIIAAPAGEFPDDVVAVCQAEQQRRQADAAQRAAQEQAAAAAEAEHRAAQAPVMVATPIVPEPVGPRRTSGGSVSTPKTWKFEITDAAALPAAYLMPDEKAIREAVKAGARQIPGVRIYEDISVRVSTR